MSFHANGNGQQWLGCCWCPAQPKPVPQTADKEYDGLLCLAAAKKSGWRVTNVSGQWLGLCPECQKRACKFPGPLFLAGISGNPAH